MTSKTYIYIIAIPPGIKKTTCKTRSNPVAVECFDSNIDQKMNQDHRFDFLQDVFWQKMNQYHRFGFLYISCFSDTPQDIPKILKICSYMARAASFVFTSHRPGIPVNHCFWIVLSQCSARKRPNRWKNLVTTVPPWQADASRVIFPNISSSANVLWWRVFSSDTFRACTMWHHACHLGRIL